MCQKRLESVFLPHFRSGFTVPWRCNEVVVNTMDFTSEGRWCEAWYTILAFLRQETFSTLSQSPRCTGDKMLGAVTLRWSECHPGEVAIPSPSQVSCYGNRVIGTTEWDSCDSCAPFTSISSRLNVFSISLLVFHHECWSRLIGYATHYLPCCRKRVTVCGFQQNEGLFFAFSKCL